MTDEQQKAAEQTGYATSGLAHLGQIFQAGYKSIFDEVQMFIQSSERAAHWTLTEIEELLNDAFAKRTETVAAQSIAMAQGAAATAAAGVDISGNGDHVEAAPIETAVAAENLTASESVLTEADLPVITN